MGQSARLRRKTSLLPRVPNRPDFVAEPFPVIAEIPAPPELAARMARGAELTGTRYRTLRNYRMGSLTIMVTREFGRWHLSIAHPERDPRWSEIAHAWYALIPRAAELTAALILPPLSEYVNLHRHCFQVHEIDPLPSSDPTGDRP